ncbi:MAG: MBOAT family protein [Bacteroidaceae bacterium]|nr:MBOAT family protein [Bacteroidaceae bacterium]
MSFTSLQFFFFLPAVFVLYWSLHRRLRLQNLLLVVSSYVFYGWWDSRFLLLIALTTMASYLSGLALEYCGRRERVRRWVAATNVVLNLGILGLFKYYDFFAENLSAALGTLGWQTDLPTLRLILPVGISFYTFQALSYTIDVFRRRLPATRDILAFFAYIAFFPQLVAGPIERATHLLPQMLRSRTFRYEEAVDGLRQMLWGFCKKMLVADSCAMAVDIIWQNPGEQSALVLLVGAFLFAIQIYGDFSGYSDIAVGCARLFGIQLMQNFRTPYFASSLTDFWRRWHISLMTWLRDYVYIPLGGNRCSRPRQYANTLTVFLLSGLWHGAAWTYVLWGLYHGVLVSGEKASNMFLDSLRPNCSSPQDQIAIKKTSLSHYGRVAVTFLLVVFGWLLFRAPNLEAFSSYVSGLSDMSSITAFGTLTMGKQALLWSVALLLIEGLQRRRCHALDLLPRGPLRFRLVRWALYYVLLMLLLFCHSENHTFIYFQF